MDFLAVIFTNIKLKPNRAPTKISCGTCTRCIETCPSGAIIAPGIIDANKCISYLTIENKKNIPEEFKGQFENWIFGCDICQDVCPWNLKFSKATSIKEFYPEKGNKEL